MTSQQTSSIQRLRLLRVKRALTAGVTFLFLYFAGFAGYLLANSSFFDLTEIKLKGNAVVSRDEIIALSGLRIGANILRISRSQALAGILSHPYIKETSISRRFPDKLEIMVSERSPMAMIHAEGRYLILDGDGYCLEEADLVKAGKWPLPCVLCSSSAAQMMPGEKSEDTGVLAALALIKKLDPYFLENILEFDAPTAEKLAVINRDGLKVLFGQPEDLDRKLQNYEELLIKNAEKCNAETLNYVDLRYDTQITLNWK